MSNVRLYYKYLLQELRNAEVAQRTRELPAWLQKENTAPDVYVCNLLHRRPSLSVVCVYLEQVLSEPGGFI